MQCRSANFRTSGGATFNSSARFHVKGCLCYCKSGMGTLSSSWGGEATAADSLGRASSLGGDLPCVLGGDGGSDGAAGAAEMPQRGGFGGEKKRPVRCRVVA
jgi:hypothetical protein